jgi:hypothetical protein
MTELEKGGAAEATNEKWLLCSKIYIENLHLNPPIDLWGLMEGQIRPYTSFRNINLDAMKMQQKSNQD